MTNLYHTYPPKYTILINGTMATEDSLVVFQFKGILPANLTHEEPLMVRKLPLQRSGKFFFMHSSPLKAVFHYVNW